MKSPLVHDCCSEPELPASAPAGAPPAAVGSGLVTSHTSGTVDGLIEIDPLLTRIRRLRRAVLTATRMHEHELRHRRHKPAMLTLTYREVGQWQPRHISELLQRVRVWLRRKRPANPS